MWAQTSLRSCRQLIGYWGKDIIFYDVAIVTLSNHGFINILLPMLMQASLVKPTVVL